MNPVYRVGLLGAGFISDHHAKPLKQLDNVELQAVCDLDASAAKRVAEKYDIPHICTDIDELLRLKLDVIHVLVPPDAHYPLTRNILESGSHVFLEKPMGTQHEECAALAALAEKNNLRLGVNHNFLFLPAYDDLRQRLRNSEFGKVNHITANWIYPLPVVTHGPFHLWMVAEPGNVMLELGSHLFSFLLDLCPNLELTHARAMNPITLPTGIDIPRKWIAQADDGQTSCSLNLSIASDFSDRSIKLNTQAAVINVDLEKNVHLIDRASTHSPPFDSRHASLNIGKQYRRQANKNLLKNIAGTLRKTTDANAYEQSMLGSIRNFYESFDSAIDSRLSATFGSRVIDACEKVVDLASIPKESAHKRTPQPASPKSNPTILVLGGTGFIGRRLVRELAQRGRSVRVVTRSMGSGNIALDGVEAELKAGSLADAEFMNEVLEGIEHVFHLARADGKNWNDYYQNDVLPTRNIAERALAAGVKRFVYTGTIDSLYTGDPKAIITGGTPIDPKISTRNFYAQAKAAGERLLTELYQQQNLPLTILRPGIVIGTGCSPYHWGIGMWWTDSLMQYWGHGKNLLPIVLVDDVAKALANSIENDTAVGKTYNLVDKPLLSARDYIAACSQASGTRIEARPTATWKYFMEDAVKSAAKFAIRHPNRAVPSYRDWLSRSHHSRYDASDAMRDLQWRPVGDREEIIEHGINVPVAETTR